MDKLIQNFAEEPALLVGLICGVLGIILAGVVIIYAMRTQVRLNAEREHTKRELAAYVAEGTLTAADAERIQQPMPWFRRDAGEGIAKIAEAMGAKRPGAPHAKTPGAGCC